MKLFHTRSFDGLRLGFCVLSNQFSFGWGKIAENIFNEEKFTNTTAIYGTTRNIPSENGKLIKEKEIFFILAQNVAQNHFETKWESLEIDFDRKRKNSLFLVQNVISSKPPSNYQRTLYQTRQIIPNFPCLFKLIHQSSQKS